MKFRKLVIACGVIAAMCAVSVPTAVSVSAAEPVRESQTIVGQINIADSENASDLQETKEEVIEEKEETSEWEGRLLVVVDEETSLNIRKDADTSSEVMGKLYRACGAEVLEKGDEWTKIRSGDVEGYVKNEYCLFGDDAAAKAEEICEKKAVTKESGIRIRSEANTDSKILTVAEEGDKFKVADSEDETLEGWVLVEYEDAVAYISSDYVDVSFDVKEAVSMETIRAQEAAKKAAEEAARKAAEEAAAAKKASEEAAAKKAAAKKASDTSSSSASASTSKSSSASSEKTSSSSAAAASDDATLLAALIQCEAGGDSYEGQLAVASVVMNRVRSGSFPNSVSGVIYQKGQFSPASSGKLSRVLSSGNISSSCYQAANAAISGTDNTGGCLYFHAGSSGSGKVIGSQIFY